MNKLTLSVAAIAVALFVTGIDAQAKGGGVTGYGAPAGGGGANAGTGLGSSGGSGIGADLVNGTLPSSSSTTKTNTGATTAGVTGYSVGGVKTANSSNLTAGTVSAGTGGMQENADGSVTNTGLLAGSQSSNKGVSLVGQSEIVSGQMLGIGNSQVSSFGRGVGNSQGSVTAMIASPVLAIRKNGQPATAANIMGAIANSNYKAQGNSLSPSATGASPEIKACANGSGTNISCD